MLVKTLMNRVTALTLSLCCIAGTAWAELPSTGTMMEAVIAEYGEPTDKTLPIGQPSITRWIYDSFTIVFEDDHVVHAFPRLNTVENRDLTAIPERPDFVSLIDQTRNKPDAQMEAVDIMQTNVDAHTEKMQIEEANEAAATVKSLEMATPQ